MNPARRARWRALLATVDPATAGNDAAWEYDAPTWMFHAFRPTGAGVEAFFPEGQAGRTAVRRLRRVFAAVPALDRAYLVPPRRRASREALVLKARTYLARMRSLLPLAIDASEVDADDPAIELLRPTKVVIGKPPEEESDDGRDLLYVLAAWYGSLRRTPSGADLREPLYGLACSYELANFVLAPLLDPDGEHGDPFGAWFWIWRHGHSLRFDVRTRRCVITQGS